MTTKKPSQPKVIVFWDGMSAQNWGLSGTRNRIFQDGKLLCAVDIDTENHAMQHDPAMIWSASRYELMHKKGYDESGNNAPWNRTEIDRSEFDGWILKHIL